MKNKQTLLEVAYKFLCKKKKCSFLEIWTHVKKQCNITKENEEKMAGDLYTAIILDPNFFLKNDKYWYPRSEVSLEEIKEQLTKIELPTISKEKDSDIHSDITRDTEITTTLVDEEFDDFDDEEDDEDTEIIDIKPLEDDYDE